MPHTVSTLMLPPMVQARSIWIEISELDLFLIFRGLMLFSLEFLCDLEYQNSFPMDLVDYYQPPTKLRRGNVFSLICLSLGWKGVPMSLCDLYLDMFKLVHFGTPAPLPSSYRNAALPPLPRTCSAGWPRHRENREFGSYFFQTGKTQGIWF